MRLASLISVTVGLAGTGCTSSTSLEDEVCGDSRVNGIERCDDGNDTGGDGCSETCMLEIDARWRFITAVGAPQGCPAGFDTVTLVADGHDVNRGRWTVPCDAMQAWLAIEALEDVALTLTVTNGAGAIWGAPVIVRAAAKGTASATTIALLVDGGYIHTTWEFYDPVAGGSIGGCGPAPSPIRIDAIEVGGPRQYSLTVPCQTGGGVMLGVGAGTYDVTLSGDAGHGPASATRTNVTVTAPNGLVELPTVTLPY